MKKLDNKVAIITGGAMGNGLGIAKVFLNYGAKVIILDYDSSLESTVQSLKNDENVVEGYSVDIRDNNKVNEIIDEIGKKYNGIDILVNNAGVCRLEKFESMNDELRDLHFDINIKGTWNVTNSAL